MIREKSKATLALLACVLFWGISFVSTKIARAVFPPMSLGALRFALALVFLFFIKKRTPGAEHLSRRDLPLLAGAGLSGVTLYFFFENTGVALISASEASIIVAAIPALTLAVEWLGAPGGLLLRRVRGLLAKGEGAAARPGSPSAPPQSKPLWGRWLGTLISIIGVALTAGGPADPASPSAAGGHILGYLCMGGAAVSWVAYCFLSRPLFGRRSRIFIVYWQTVFGFLGFIPFAVFEAPQWGKPDLRIVLHVAFLGILCSALAYWFYAHSLAVLGIPLSALFLNFIPVVTVAVGYVVLAERLRPVQWAGAALVLAGVSLATSPGAWSRRHRRQKRY
ncbi:MAG: DMT family transporter [Spirochaetaceae bacterium]|jgi:drug/metabolite transporter (DMT)-like permease|nr:DMT family transporter [Spirochaetaceae bacterium]